MNKRLIGKKNSHEKKMGECQYRCSDPLDHNTGLTAMKERGEAGGFSKKYLRVKHCSVKVFPE